MKKTVKTLTALFFLSGLAFLTIFPSSKLMAQGNLLVTPKRVVFDGNKRSEELNLANIGKDTATYIISFIQIREKKIGNLIVKIYMMKNYLMIILK